MFRKPLIVLLIIQAILLIAKLTDAIGLSWLVVLSPILVSGIPATALFYAITFVGGEYSVGFEDDTETNPVKAN